MPSNYPGPFEIEIHYTAGGLDHTARLNCNTGTGVPTVGVDPTVETLLKRDATTITIQAAAAEYANLMKVWLNTSDSVDTYDFYAYPTPGGVRQYITSGTLGISGTSASASNLAHQQTYTFKTLEGGTMRVVLLETVLTSKQRIPYATLSTTEKNFMDYVCAADTWIYARDTSFPVIPLAGIGGQNEAVFKKRYR